MYLNKAIIVGNLTRDPELKALPSGMQVASMSIATNLVYKNKAGEKQEQVEFHNVVVFGRQAETAAQYLKKGQQAMIEGRIQTRSWDDKKSGEKKYRTEIVADRVQFGAKPAGSQPASGGGGSVGRPVAPATSKPAVEPGFEDFAGDINPEDIPF